MPPEVETAIDKRSSMAAVGNLNDYVKFQMAQGMEKGGGAGGAATELAVGLVDRAADHAAAGACPARPRASAAAPAAVADCPICSSPADVAKALGVPEADVMAIIESGELAAKKIGSVVPHQAGRARRVPGEVSAVLR